MNEKKYLKDGIMKLNYKFKAKALLNQDIYFNEIGLSWLETKTGECIFVKTQNDNDNIYFKFLIKSKNHNILKKIENVKISEIYLGIISDKKIIKMKISNLRVKKKKENLESLFIKLEKTDNGFILSENSHITCDLDLEKIEVAINMPSWMDWYNIDTHIENIATTERCKEFEDNNKDFREWYRGKEKKCCYCGIKEEELKKYFNEKNSQYYISEDDKARQRGKYLEIERIETAPKSRNKYIPDNTDLACYVCNNAKSDFISPTDFKLIARGINKFWKEQVRVNIENFNDESDIWEK